MVYKILCYLAATQNEKSANCSYTLLITIRGSTKTFFSNKRKQFTVLMRDFSQFILGEIIGRISNSENKSYYLKLYYIFYIFY